MKLFLNAGVRPDEKDALGVTPLIKAAMFNRGAVAALLIKANADVNMANTQGYTPLHWAVAERLPRHRRDAPSPRARAWIRAAASASLPLMQAAMSGHARVCDALIAKGAGVNEADKRGNTPLHKAVTDGHVAVVENPGCCRAPPSDKGDDKGVTPLAIAQRKKNPAMLAVLAKSGAASRA